jgi:hypothetical protein
MAEHCEGFARIVVLLLQHPNSAEQETYRITDFDKGADTAPQSFQVLRPADMG